jgi:hypothetical protein
MSGRAQRLGPGPLRSAAAGIPSRLAIAAIGVYQRALSPLLGSHCRFVPSCSEYAVLAIGEWGAVRGITLAAWRILRCHPFTSGGFDLPPHRHVGGARMQSGKPHGS